jgi:hypothetical protein
MKKSELRDVLLHFEISLERFRINPNVDLDRNNKLTPDCIRRLSIYAQDSLPWPEDHSIQDPEEIRKEKMRRGSPELQAFRWQVKRNLMAAGCESADEYLMKFPGEHLWASMSGWESCAFCGVCKSRDPKGNGRCKGVVRVTLRD